MSKFQVLAVQIGNWSVNNFGNSPVDYLVIGENGVELNYLAPLLGIGEEIGELCEALESPMLPKFLDATLDSLGDIGIYLCDYCKRRSVFPIMPSNADLTEFNPMFGNGRGRTYNDLMVGYGKILRCELKHAQKIRGMDNLATFIDTLRTSITEFYFVLNNISLRLTGNCINSIIEGTFREVVAKRNWKLNNATGATSEG